MIKLAFWVFAAFAFVFAAVAGTEHAAAPGVIHEAFDTLQAEGKLDVVIVLIACGIFFNCKSICAAIVAVFNRNKQNPQQKNVS